MLCNTILQRPLDYVKMMIWEGQKAIFSCDHCEKCECTEISQIRFRGDDNPEISFYNVFMPITGKIVMRCKRHRINNYSFETETIYRPNPIEIKHMGLSRIIQGPMFAETSMSHNPQRDKIIFDEEDMTWTNIK